MADAQEIGQDALKSYNYAKKNRRALEPNYQAITILPMQLNRRIVNLDLTAEEELEIYNSYHHLLANSKYIQFWLFFSEEELAKIDFERVPLPTMHSIFFAKKFNKDFKFHFNRVTQCTTCCRYFFVGFFVLYGGFYTMIKGIVNWDAEDQEEREDARTQFYWGLLFAFGIPFLLAIGVLFQLRRATLVIRTILLQMKKIQRDQDHFYFPNEPEVRVKAMYDGLKQLNQGLSCSLNTILASRLGEATIFYQLHSFVYQKTGQHVFDGIRVLGDKSARFARDGPKHVNLQKLIMLEATSLAATKQMSHIVTSAAGAV